MEALRRATRNLAAIGAPDPVRKLLAPARRSAARDALARFRPRVEKLRAPLERGEARARDELARLAEEALSEMRRRVAKVAANSGGATNWAASVDAWWRRTDESEYLDDPDLDERVRVRILSHLDAMNELLGSYRLFFDRLRPLLGPRKTRLLDLAAGHGGFALAIARSAREEGIDLEVVASDIKHEYLALGERRAREEGLEVRFSMQDALDLSNLEPGAYDVVTCTQALHHFLPGQIALMFGEAARIAARGVVFIDGARSTLTGAAAWAIGVLGFRDRALAHDSLVSFRRFFVAEELELLGKLVPRGERARASVVAPSHCLLELGCV
jgi:2-polyprenyl-3-methyl-5-hydroxy-6-metoxy-1,4-benzoquinol methylase